MVNETAAHRAAGVHRLLRMPAALVRCAPCRLCLDEVRLKQGRGWGLGSGQGMESVKSGGD